MKKKISQTQSNKTFFLNGECQRFLRNEYHLLPERQFFRLSSEEADFGTRMFQN